MTEGKKSHHSNKYNSEETRIRTAPETRLVVAAAAATGHRTLRPQENPKEHHHRQGQMASDSSLCRGTVSDSESEDGKGWGHKRGECENALKIPSSTKTLHIHEVDRLGPWT